MIKWVVNLLGVLVVIVASIYFLVFAFEGGRLVVRARTEAEKETLLSHFRVGPSVPKPKQKETVPPPPPAPKMAPKLIPQNEKQYDRKGVEKILEEAE